jgi:beta-N-acetylhexosaminidase
LFSRNVKSKEQLAKLTADLQSIAKSAGHQQGLLIAIDQENGIVSRLKPAEVVQFPGSMALAATQDPSNAFKVATATAKTLKALGINMNYAPVADVNSEPKNPVIGVRSFSDDPEMVGRFVSAQIKGFQSAGIIPCVKHFPGHGDTAVDSHYALPIINKGKAEMDACELIPFRRAVGEGVDAVMTAHIVVPGIDASTSNLPASLNPRVIDILRTEMHYDGLVISDCLEMDGVRAPFGTSDAAVMALKVVITATPYTFEANIRSQAGTDCLMVCHTIASQVGAIEKIVQAVKTGEISRQRLQASVDRIRSVKKKYLGFETTQIPRIIADSQTTNIDIASKIYAQSTTIVRSAQNLLPIVAGGATKVTFLRPEQLSNIGGAVESGEENRNNIFRAFSYIEVLAKYGCNILEIAYDDSKPLTTDAENKICEADFVIFASHNASRSLYQKEMGLSLGKTLGRKLIVITTCDPYDFLEESQYIENYIVIYEPTIPAFKSAFDIIFGYAEAKGKLPVGTPHQVHAISTGSATDLEKVWHMWQYIFPRWSIDRLRLQAILSSSSARLYIHDKGFCLAFFVNQKVAKIAIIGVLPTCRGQGIGTTLVKTTHQRISSECALGSFGIGSVFPRLWPGVPVDFPQSDKDFFLHRGFYLYSCLPKSILT